LGVIVHSEWMRQQLQKQDTQVPIAVIPHGVKVFPNSERQRALLRSSLGLAPDTLIVGCFGRIEPTKRIEIVIRAFSRLHALVPRSVLFLVGSPGPGMEARIEKAAVRCGVGDSLRMTGYVTERAFDAYLQVSDICVNLRYPSAGETSGTLCRALGAGLPVLATNLEQFAEFPDECVWRVDVGENEEDELVAHLLELAAHPHLRRQMGQAAQKYVLQHATWSQVAAQYAEFIRQVVDRFDHGSW
jgi:glycosyltransferase involved in cell wall biosynthesis